MRVARVYVGNKKELEGSSSVSTGYLWEQGEPIGDEARVTTFSPEKCRLADRGTRGDECCVVGGELFSCSAYSSTLKMELIITISVKNLKSYINDI